MALHPASQSPRPLAGEGGPQGRERARIKRVALSRAKKLRSALTDAEQRLWYHLRAHRFFDLKFKRQKPIGPYIVDFICMERRLVVELDGGQHSERSAYDAKRDRWLQSKGWKVLRFWNDQVLEETESVLDNIRTAALPPTALRAALSPAPLPQAGEGTH